MSNSLNVKMGVCSVSFKGTDLGHTKGGVEVTYDPQWSEITVDKYGKTVVEKKLTGEKVTVKVPLAEYTADNLLVAIPAGTQSGTTHKKLSIGSDAGKSLLAQAGQLILHPVGESNKDFDVVLHKAAVTSSVTIKHQVETERVVEVTFEALIDETKADGSYLGFIGDSAN